MKPNNLLGQRFCRLIVVADGGRCNKRNILWLCRCDCGGETTAYAYDLRSGRVKSCGCYNREGSKRVTHGQAGRLNGRSPTYNIWAEMVQRCTNPKSRSWPHYGGRGVTLCDRWRKFENFWEDMGDRPQGKSLDRIDNNGGYSPGNCRWADTHTQTRNKRNNVFVTVRGVTHCLADWCRHLGVSKQAIYYWVKKGLTYEAAIERVISKNKG